MPVDRVDRCPERGRGLLDHPEALSRVGVGLVDPSVSALDQKRRWRTLEGLHPAALERRIICDTYRKAASSIDFVDRPVEAGDEGPLRSTVISDVFQIIPGKSFSDDDLVTAANVYEGNSPHVAGEQVRGSKEV